MSRRGGAPAARRANAITSHSPTVTVVRGVIAAGIVREDEAGGRRARTGRCTAGYGCRRISAVSAIHTVRAPPQIVPHGGADGVRGSSVELHPRGVAHGDELGWTSPSTQVSRPPAPASAPAIIRSGLWCTAIGQGSGRAGNCRCHPLPQVGCPELDPAGRPAAAPGSPTSAAAARLTALDELRRVANSASLTSSQTSANGTMSVPSTAARSPVGLVEVPRVQRAAGRGEPPCAVEHQRQRRAQAIQDVRAQPHGVAAQALLVDERTAGVELARPARGRDAGQAGERRLQAGHGRSDPVRVTGRRRPVRPGRRSARPGPFRPARGHRRR